MEVDINKELLAIMLLYSLPESYDNFRCAIECRDTLPDPEALKIKIIEESDSRKSKYSEIAEDALAVKSNSNSRFKNDSQNRNVNTRSSSPKFKFKCHRCGKVGHKAANCFQKNNNKNNGSNHFMASNTTLCINCCSGNKWCLDSGSSSHLCKDQCKFTDFKKVNNNSLNLASSATTKVEGKGAVRFEIEQGNKIEGITLDNALYVPDLRMDLLSVGLITDKGYKVLFTKENAKILESNGTVKFIANRINGLYYFTERSQLSNNVTTNKSLMESELWHRRFGHLNQIDLQNLVKKKLVFGI